GLEDSRIDDGQSAIDLMDRTAGHADWMVVKPYPTSTSNCVLPASVVRQLIEANPLSPADSAAFNGLVLACDVAYNPSTPSIFTQLRNPSPSDSGVTGFVSAASPNDGEGFSKDLGGT